MAEHVDSCGMIFRRNVPVIQVAIRPMLNPMPPWVAPIVKHLTAEGVTPDSPHMPVAALHQVVVTRPNIVEIMDFEAQVVQAMLVGTRNQERMVVRGDMPPVAAHECHDVSPRFRRRYDAIRNQKTQRLLKPGLRRPLLDEVQRNMAKTLHM